MERWRWMPHDLGNTYVIVNLPDFMLRCSKRSASLGDKNRCWQTRDATPIMTAEMKSITINPMWNIRDTIVAKEYLPLMRQDSTIFERMP
jgi:murein L,D-transpeptidase YcbB/YkuD